MRCVLFCLSLLLSTHVQAVEVLDLAGRRIEVPVRVNRILLGEGRFLPALALLERANPAARVVGMLGEYERFDPDGYAQYRARFPQLDKIARIGRSSADSFSVETAISLVPDLAIFALEGHGPAPHNREIIQQLEKAGITVAFIDFRKEPLKNTLPSIELLGKLLGREREAAEYTALYRKAMAAIKVPAGGRQPSVFIDNRAGSSATCCETMGRGMMGHFITAAGGRNIAADMISGTHGTLSLEYLLTHAPDVYIGTAIGSPTTAERYPQRIILGAGVDEQAARASLARAVARPGISELAAVRAGRVHGLWHHFYNSPFNVVAVQVMAKWLHPEANAKLDPLATWREIHARFLPVPLAGSYWVGP